MFLTMLLLPFIGSFIAGTLGRLLGVKGTNIIVLGCLFISMVLSLIIGYEVVLSGSPVTLRLGSWLDTGLLHLDWGFTLDTLGSWLAATVLVISFFVHVFATSYMSSDPTPQRFMCLLIGFTASMIILVTGDTLGVLFLGWEGNFSCLTWGIHFDAMLCIFPAFSNSFLEKKELEKYKIKAGRRNFHIEGKIPSSLRIGPHNKDVISVIAGSLLGDGHLEKRKQGVGTRLILEQSSEKIEYLMWLHQFFALRGYCPKKIPTVSERGRQNGKSYFHYRFSTYTFRSLNELHSLFYSSKYNSLGLKKVVPPTDWLIFFLTPLALSIWFMDDGSCLGSGYKLSTCGFELKEVEQLCLLLKNLYNLSCSSQKDRHLFHIYIKKESALRFSKLVSPYIVDTLQYKLGPYSKHKLIDS